MDEIRNTIPKCRLIKIIFKEPWYGYRFWEDECSLEQVPAGWEKFTVCIDGTAEYENQVMKESFEVDPLEAEWYLDTMLRCINSETSRTFTSYGGNVGRVKFCFEDGTIIRTHGNWESGKKQEETCQDTKERYLERCESRWMKNKIARTMDIELESDPETFKKLNELISGRAELIIDDGAKATFRIEVVPFEFAYSFLSSFDGKVKIVAPENIRKEYDLYLEKVLEEG